MTNTDARKNCQEQSTGSKVPDSQIPPTQSARGVACAPRSTADAGTACVEIRVLSFQPELRSNMDDIQQHAMPCATTLYSVSLFQYDVIPNAESRRDAAVCMRGRPLSSLPDLTKFWKTYLEGSRYSTPQAVGYKYTLS